MDALTLSAVCIVCSAQPAVVHYATKQWAPIMAEASARFDVPESWIAAVMRAESGGHTTLNGRPITSSAGAMGLMQVMPATYEDLRRRYGFGRDPYAVRDNIFAGAAYLRELYVRYGYPDLFAAYNAGPHRLDAFLGFRRALPNATVAYVDTIIPAGASAFGSPNSASVGAASHVGNALFVTLNSTSTSPTDTTKPQSISAPISIDHQPNSAVSNSSLFVRLSQPTP